jgi:hypothetical protein
MNLPRTFGAGALLLACCLSFGCGAKNPLAPGSISGSVSYKGKPLPGGTVQYVTSEGVPYSSPIAQDGTYAIADLPAGELVVVVETASAKERAAAKSKEADRRMSAQQPRPGGAPAAAEQEAPVYVPIPEKYGKPKSSPLTFTVKAGRNVNNIELTD